MPTKKRAKRRVIEPWKIFQRKRKGSASSFWYFKDEAGQHIATHTACPITAQKACDRARVEFEHPEKAATFTQLALDYGEARLSEDRPLSNNEVKWISDLGDWFGDTLAIDIKPIHLKSFADTLTVKNKTIRRQVYTPFNAIMNLARQRYELPPYLFKAPKSEPDPVRPFADQAWIDSFLASCTELELTSRYPDVYIRLAATVQLCYQSGWRITSVLNSIPRLDKERLFLPKSKDTPEQEVELTEQSIELIRQCQALNKSVLLFGSREKLTEPVKRVCKHANIPYMSSHQWGRIAANNRKMRIAAELGISKADANIALGYSPASDIPNKNYMQANREAVSLLQKS